MIYLKYSSIIQKIIPLINFNLHTYLIEIMRNNNV